MKFTIDYFLNKKLIFLMMSSRHLERLTMDAYNVIASGWAILVGSTTISDVTVNGATYHIPYVLRVHGNKMLEMDANITVGYLVMHVDSTADKGEITVIIPKALLDPQNHDFVVLVDGAEVKYTEVVTQTTNTLTIPFGFGAKEIEVTISRLV